MRTAKGPDDDKRWEAALYNTLGLRNLCTWASLGGESFPTMLLVLPGFPHFTVSFNDLFVCSVGFSRQGFPVQRP